MGQFSEIVGPIPKPSRLKPKAAKYERTVERRKDKAREDAAIEREAKKVRDQVWARDKARCRAYGVPLKRVSDNPLVLGQVDHLHARSLGGPDETENEVLLSPIAHERKHLRYDAVGLRIEGNADETLTLTEFDLETGAVLRVWDSPVPQ